GRSRELHHGGACDHGERGKPLGAPWHRATLAPGTNLRAVTRMGEQAALERRRALAGCPGGDDQEWHRRQDRHGEPDEAEPERRKRGRPPKENLGEAHHARQSSNMSKSAFMAFFDGACERGATFAASACSEAGR